MARDIQKRLNQLSTRRRGLDQISLHSMDTASEIIAKSNITEAYQKRSSQPNTQYALGAMQEVGPAYTQVGLDEANRVGKQLSSGLSNYGISVGFELQGSVPLNVHIRGVSDVDLLTLHTAFVTYDANGNYYRQGYYSNPTSYTAEDKMRELRSKSESVLSASYPAAKVDKSGSKAIKISGGSLRRAIDVVPAHWHDTKDWQSSQQKHDRGVKVYNKSDHTTFLNMPFKHIKLITDRDRTTSDGLKKTIRLCKNVKSDAEADGKTIALSSYEIASLMWHCDSDDLNVPGYSELSLLLATQQHLDFLSRNVQYTMSLVTPDGSRKIIENTERVQGLIALSLELDDLAAEVAKEQAKLLQQSQPTQEQIRESLNRSYLPLSN